MEPVRAEEPPDGGFPGTLESVVRVNPEDFRAIPDGMWHHIRLGDLELDNLERHVGSPQLPVMVKWFLLPPGTSVASVGAVTLEQTEVEGSYLPYPILGEEAAPDGPPDSPPWENIVFPREQAFLCQVGEARRYQLAKIALYPLQYDAARQSIRILETIRLSVTLRSLTAEESQSRLQILRPEAADDVFRVHRRWIRGTVENPGDLDWFYPIYTVDESEDGEPGDGARRARALSERTPLGSFVSESPSKVGQSVDYLIITNNYDEKGNAIGDMEEVFRSWGEQLPGLRVAVRTVDFIESEAWRWPGYDRADRIRRFLRDAVQYWGVTYVLLGGDESVVPTRRLGGPNQEGLDRPDPVCDYWYTRIGSDWAEGWNTNGDSWIGETSTDIGMSEYNLHGFSSIFVTRMPARNATEASAMTTKTLNYFSGAGYPPSQWYRKVLVAAGPTNSADTTAVGSNGIPTAEYIIDPLIDAGNWDIRRLYPNVGAAKTSRCQDDPSGPDTCHCPLRGDTCYLELHEYVSDRIGDEYWTGDDLRETLSDTSSAPHLFYHMEHSERDRLGRPSGSSLSGAPTQGCPVNWDETACPSVLEGVLKNIEHLDINEVLALRNGVGGQPRYMFVFSSGSWTNMMDMNSIGESFLRAPDGGAVFYVGKAATFGGTRYIQYRRSIENAFLEGVSPFSAAVLLGIDETLSDIAEIKAHADLNLLGDAVIFAWTGSPREPDIAVSPSTITSLGIQSVTVTVTDPDTSSPIEGALVDLKQGDWTAARKSTDSQGRAALKGILIQNAQDSVYVSVFRPGYLPTTVSLPVQVSAPYVVYASHELDDCVTGGDCDGIFEAGETCEIDVTLKNEGSSATQTGSATLRPTPAFVAKLQTNGAYRPGDIYLGKSGAHPGTEADTFRVPFSETGIRVEGAPPGGGTIRREVFRIWRAEATGLYTIAAYSHSQSYDSLFTGIIKGEADFSNVSMTGESADQYFASGDSIWFQFHGDATEDKITFRAEAPDWFTMNTSTASLPALQPGGTTTVTFSMTNLDDLPDRENIVFTLSAYHGILGTSYFTSDFVVESVKPDVAFLGVDREFGDFGCADTTWRWTPVIHNRGGGAADSVRLTLHVTAGSMAVLDSTVTFVDVEPGTMLTDESFLLCGESVSDTTGFGASVTEEVFHKLYYEIADSDHGGGGGPPRPDSLEADLVDGTVLLRWKAVVGATKYLVEIGTSPEGPRTPLDETSVDATRYQVLVDLESPSGNAYETPYYFWVRACYYGLCGSRAMVGPIYPWVHEREGWPKLLPGMPICAPLVGDLSEGIEDGGLAIFAALDRIYAWRPDGSPLDPNSTDGSFCDPWDVEGTEPGVDERFTEALAFGDLSEHEGVELVGNFRGKGFFLMGITEENGEIVCLPHWGRSTYSYQAPIVAPYLDSVGETLIFLGGAPDRYIYGWFADDPTLPVGQNHHFATLPVYSANSYESLAIGYNTTTHEHELIAMTREGHLWCYDASSPTDGGFLQWDVELDPVLQEDNREFLSTPAVGDVDGDGDNDIVITTLWRQESAGPCGSGLVPGRLFIVDEESGDTTSVGSCDFHFRDESGDVPPAGPSLAQLDDDAALEILIASAHAKGIDEQGEPVGITLLVFEVENGETIVHSAEASIPHGTRNDETGHPQERHYGDQYPIGSPIVGDFDPDPDDEYAKPDVFVTTSQGAIFCFEYDYQANLPLYAKPGWPLLLPDVAREPVLAQLDPDDPGQFSLVVQCQDGYLHVYDLPKTSETGGAPEWGSYGGNPRNTRGKLSGVGARPVTGAGPSRAGAPSIRAIGPSPSHGLQEIVIFSGRKAEVRLDLYDVSGRRVRNVFEGTVRAGSTILRWDGTLENGARAPSGIYWYRLRSEAGTETRRIVVVR